MTRVLVTGATGFVGSALASHCQQTGFDIRTTGRNQSPPESFPDYIAANILEPASLKPLFRGIDQVVHAAGLAHQFNPRTQKHSFSATNLDGAENMARAAVDASIQHFVLISSVSVYGASQSPCPSKGCSEDYPCHPKGSYAQSKYLAEQRTIEIAQASGMSLSILRLATVYGEGDPGNVARLMRMIDRGRFVWIGSGKNYKSLIHRNDVARACVSVLKSTPQSVAIYNVSPAAYSMAEIVNRLADALTRRVPRWHIPAPPLLGIIRFASRLGIGGDRVRRTYGTLKKWLENDIYDGSRFEKQFGFRPQIGLAEGLCREVASYRAGLDQVV